jgi:superfamily II DNA or RNA helicase
LSIPLRAYQRQAIDAVNAAEARGVTRPLVVKPTGSGKTITFAHLLLERAGRGLVLAHRDELVTQAVDKLRMVAPELRVGVCKAERDELHAQVVVASVQTLARPNRLARLIDALTHGRTLFETPDPLRTVVVDEAHHHVAGADGNTFGVVLDALAALPSRPLVVGFTATPDPLTKSEDGELAGGWQEVVFQLGILDGIREGWLVDVKGKEVKLAGVDFRDLHSSRGEIRADEADAMLMEADAPQHAARAYLEHAERGWKALAFTPTIASAHAFARAFRAAGVPSEAVDGEMPMDERRAILRRLATGETLVVPNAQCLTEGFDQPDVRVVIMARPTRSRVFALQCIGRALRPFPGKEFALILDLVGSVKRHDLMTVSALFGVKDEAVAERGLLAASSEEEQAAAAAMAAPGEPEQDQRRLVSRDIELFKGRNFAWVIAGDRYVLSLGEQGMVAVEVNAEGLHDVLLVKSERIGTRIFKGREVAQYRETRKKLFAGLNLDYATGAAEDYVRKAGALRLNAKDASWRVVPASPAQQQLLQKWGKWRPGMSKGEASDAISARMARRRATA